MLRALGNSRCTSLDYTNARKKTASRLRNGLRRRRGKSRMMAACIKHSACATVSELLEATAHFIEEFLKSPCVADTFSIATFMRSCLSKMFVTYTAFQNHRFADSELGILAIKLFSKFFAFCPASPRCGRVFEHFPKTDSAAWPQHIVVITGHGRRRTALLRL